MIISCYLDIKLKEVIPSGLNKALNYAQNHGLAVILGMDSNAHSSSFGNTTNKRGDQLDLFIAHHKLDIENQGLRVFFFSSIYVGLRAAQLLCTLPTSWSNTEQVKFSKLTGVLLVTYPINIYFSIYLILFYLQAPFSKSRHTTTGEMTALHACHSLKYERLRDNTNYCLLYTSPSPRDS